MAGYHRPVEDWATDFDHTDPIWAADPYPIWAEIRSSGCPVAHSERYGGVWLPTRHEDITAVAYDHEHFTSRSVVVTEGRPIAEAPVGIAPPISSDPPFHHGARRLLLPAFAPKAVERLEPYTRDFCNELLDRALADGASVIDAAQQYAQEIPVRIIAKMLGWPVEDAPLYRRFVHNLLENVDAPIEQRMEWFGELDAYMRAQIEEHVTNPQDDLTTYLLNARLDDKPLTPEHIGGTIALLLLAGIDTTWSAIGASLWHLATHDEDRRRLVAEPELLGFAIEEFLRAYAPVTMARLVSKDHDFNGCPMKANEWVLLPFPAANRDPEVFEDPDVVRIDRQENRHAAFGLGIHRCVGSNLARMELTVAVETWLARIPEFSLAPEGEVHWSGGQVRGPRQLPISVG